MLANTIPLLCQSGGLDNTDKVNYENFKAISKLIKELDAIASELSVNPFVADEDLYSYYMSKFDKFTTVLKSNGMYRQKRAKNLLATLRSSGLYVDSLSELLTTSKIASRFMDLHFLYYKLFFFKDFAGICGNLSAPIPIDVWLDAIDMSVCTCHPKIFFNPRAQWDLDVEDFAATTYLFVIYKMLARELLGDNTIKRYDDPKRDDEIKELRQRVQKLTTDRDEEVAKLQAEIKRLREESKQLSAQFSSKLEEQARMLKHEESLALKEKDKIITYLQEDADDLRQTIELLQYDGSSSDNDVDNTQELLNLPDTGIVFMGGNINLKNKLKRVHPKWTYIEPNDFRGIERSSEEIVFVFVKTLSHKVWRSYKVRNTKAPMFIVTDTNVELLEKSMRRLYTNHVNG